MSDKTSETSFSRWRGLLAVGIIVVAGLLATHEDARIRDGAKAVRLAERACQLTGSQAPEILGTLAAAYAEVGQFDKAVKTAEKAMQLARATKSEKLANDIQNRLKHYKAKRPFRTSAH